MADIDLNRFDEEKFESDEEYQDEVRNTPVGTAIEVLATSMTLQDCGEFLAIAQPDLLPKFFAWAEKNYPDLDIDVNEAVKMVKEAVESGEIGIERP
jgi:hypothetical protein